MVVELPVTKLMSCVRQLGGLVLSGDCFCIDFFNNGSMATVAVLILDFFEQVRKY